MSMCGCFLCTPHWGPGLHPRHVLCLGIKPATLWFTGQCSIQSHTSQGVIYFLLLYIVFAFCKVSFGRNYALCILFVWLLFAHLKSIAIHPSFHKTPIVRPFFIVKCISIVCTPQFVYTLFG